MEKIKKYTKDKDYSYALGAFPSIEAIKNIREDILTVFIHSTYREREELIEYLEKENIPYSISDRAINRLRSKGNTLLVCVFKKNLKEVIDENHIVLEEIQNMGNLGTIIRTMLAMGIRDLVTIGNSCDIYDPKVIRASMGAIFKIRHSHFDSMEAYYEKFKANRRMYFFLLNDRARKLNEISHDWKKNFSLVYGNEGSGLKREYGEFGDPIFIPQTKEVDSLNLPISVSIGIYEFMIGGRNEEANNI